MDKFQIIDNFLSEDEFKSLQKWAEEQDCDHSQYWPSELLDTNDINIEKPGIRRDVHIETMLDDDDIGELSNFRDRLSDIITSYPENKDVKYTEFTSSIYRFKYGSGILLHRDNVGPSGRRYGISFYLNDEWHPNWGGELILYSGNENIYMRYQEGSYPGLDDEIDFQEFEPIVTILPKRNRLVIVDGPWHKLSPNLNKNVDRLSIQSFYGCIDQIL